MAAMVVDDSIPYYDNFMFSGKSYSQWLTEICVKWGLKLEFNARERCGSSSPQFEMDCIVNFRQGKILTSSRSCETKKKGQQQSAFMMLGRFRFTTKSLSTVNLKKSEIPIEMLEELVAAGNEVIDDGVSASKIPKMDDFVVNNEADAAVSFKIHKKEIVFAILTSNRELQSQRDKRRHASKSNHHLADGLAGAMARTRCERQLLKKLLSCETIENLKKNIYHYDTPTLILDELVKEYKLNGICELTSSTFPCSRKGLVKGLNYWTLLSLKIDGHHKNISSSGTGTTEDESTGEAIVNLIKFILLICLSEDTEVQQVCSADDSAVSSSTDLLSR